MTTRYFLQLVRYIHRNPVKAGIASKPDDYPWSSHKGYMSVAKKWTWLHKEFIFSMLTKNRKEIGRQFHMEKHSSISSIIERMKKQMLEDRNLKKRVDRVTDGASKSQEQT